MGRLLDVKNGTNVRLSIPEAVWDLIADWTVGDIAAPTFTEYAPFPADLHDEQYALEYELFHRDDNGLSIR